MTPRLLFGVRRLTHTHAHTHTTSLGFNRSTGRLPACGCIYPYILMGIPFRVYTFHTNKNKIGKRVSWSKNDLCNANTRIFQMNVSSLESVYRVEDWRSTCNSFLIADFYNYSRKKNGNLVHKVRREELALSVGGRWLCKSWRIKILSVTIKRATP